MCPSFPFGIEGGMWDVIVLIPDHCLSIYFAAIVGPLNDLLVSHSTKHSSKIKEERGF